MLSEQEIRRLRQAIIENARWAREHGQQQGFTDASPSEAAANALSIVLGEPPTAWLEIHSCAGANE
jgi:hypothetical protein